MSNVPLDRIINTAQLRLVGTTVIGIKNELYSVCDEFCQKSGAWYDTVQFTAVPMVLGYTIMSPVGQIIRLKGVTNGGGSQMDAAFNLPTDLELAAAPAAADTYTAWIVLTVNDPVDRNSYPLIPKQLAIKYNSVLLDGVLGHMMSQQAKPYTDQNMAAYHLRRFRSGIAQATLDALKQNTEQNQAWRFPQGFATRSQRR